MKKLKILLILAIIIIFPITVKAENNKAKFILEEKEASIGDEISINLNLENNMGFGVLTLRIDYDKESLEYLSSQLNSFKSAMLKGAEIDQDGKIVLYALTLGNLIEDNGNVLAINFKIKNTDKEDNELKIDVENFGVDENTKLEYETQNGKIKINNIIPLKSEEEKTIQSIIPEEVKDKPIKWSSSDESVATVDETGKVYFKGKGNVKITGTTDDEEKKQVYEKEYQVNNETNKTINNKKNYIPLIIVIIIVILICIVLTIILKKKKINIKKS